MPLTLAFCSSFSASPLPALATSSSAWRSFFSSLRLSFAGSVSSSTLTGAGVGAGAAAAAAAAVALSSASAAALSFSAFSFSFSLSRFFWLLLSSTGAAPMGSPSCSHDKVGVGSGRKRE